MLHLLADSTPEPKPQAYAEAVARLASVRHALRLVEPFGAGPASDFHNDEEIAARWDDAGEPRRRWFDKRSEKLVAATADGVEALLNEHKAGRTPHQAAAQELVDQIRRELEQVANVVLA